MKVKKLSCLNLLVVVPLLMSASAPQIYSNIFEMNVKARSLIKQGSYTQEVLTRGKEELAAKFKFNYEFYKMDQTTLLWTEYIPSYSLIYRIDVLLNNDVNYSSGIFDWFSSNSSVYLDFINVRAEFSNISNLGKYNQDTRDDEKVYVLEVDPFMNYYAEEKNKLYETSSMSQNFSFDSLSYRSSIGDLPYLLPSTYDLRTAIKPLSYASKSSNSSELSFTNNYEFGYEIVHSGSSFSLGNDGNPKKYYSGPNSDEKPFDFSYFGAMNFESDSTPKCTVKFGTKITYGHNSYLNDFSSETNSSISI